LETLRDLIDRVELGPKDESGEPSIMLTGALAAMLQLGMGHDTGAKPVADPAMFLSSVKVVAGARFELTTFRWGGRLLTASMCQDTGR
jgi:site-specific DNA recombinase